MKILVVDDSDADLQLVAIYLKQAGHDVITAENGIVAIDLYQNKRPDLILSDVIMPELDGYGLARKIRSLAPGDWVPIIFLSAMVSDDDLVLGIQSGGDDYLTKPINRPVLLAKIHAMERIVSTRQRLLEVMEQLAEANRQLQHMTNRDGLTQVANRRCFDATLAREWDEAARYQRQMSLLLLDVDHFKLYNDTYGHQSGDVCLQKIAEILSHCVHRPCDLAARYGGEEFAVILPDTDTLGAEKLAERICESVLTMGLPHEQSSHDVVTISIGSATMIAEPMTTAATLLHTADEALYQAKVQGRNKVIVAKCQNP